MEPIRGIKHPAFRDALALTRAAERQRAGCYLVETSHLAHQALRSPSEVVSVFALPSETASLVPECAARNVPLYELGSGLLNKLVGTGYETAVTAAAVVRQRVLVEEELPAQGETLVLAGEEIQDPRNVGVLIRTAEAAGCAALLLSTNSAEPFSRAAVRSTTGSILRLPLCLCADLAATLHRLREGGVMVVASSAHAPTLIYASDLNRRPLVIVVGNETAGISTAVRAEASDFVALPMAPNGASSLNVTVAAGILLYEAVRQRLS